MPPFPYIIFILLLYGGVKMVDNEIYHNLFSETVFSQEQSLEERLKNISLSDEEVEEITEKQTLKTLLEKGLPILGPLGEVAATLIGWGDEMNEEMRKKKEEKLLMEYFSKTDEQLGTISKLKDFVTDPYGFTLFNKILSILRDTPADSDLVDHLSSVLKNIIQNGYFEELFEKYKYVLNQIEKVTPQGLTILSDSNAWPPFSLNASTYFGGKVSSDFHKEFTQAYAAHKHIHDEDTIIRIEHSIRELQNANLIEAYKAGERNNCECRLTEVGQDIVNYIV